MYSTSGNNKYYASEVEIVIVNSHSVENKVKIPRLCIYNIK